MQRIEVNVLTGEQITVDLTPDEISQAKSIWDSNLSNRQESKWNQIKLKRDFVQSGGVFVNDKWFHSDISSRVKINFILSSESVEEGLQWKTMDGSFVPMTLDLAKQIVSAINSLDSDSFLVSQKHKQSMLSSSDPDNYDYSSEWPSTFMSQNN